MGISTRQSNFELLRLVAMLMVLVTHANFLSFGAPSLAEWYTSSFATFSRVFLMQATVICVNVFILISGWFGIRITKVKILTLLFQVLFCSCIALILAKYLLNVNVGIKDIGRTILIGSDYWFVIAYFILILFSPLINGFVESAGKNNVLSFLIFFYILSTLYGMMPFDFGKFGDGYSGLSFIGLYTLARYIKVHSGVFFIFKPKIDFLIYIAVVLFATGVFFFYTKYSSPYLRMPMSYNNPLILIGSVYFFLFFSKIKINSKIINFLAPSAFSIYLIHTHPLILSFYCDTIQCIAEKNTVQVHLFQLGLFIVSVAIMCILIDMIRRGVWHFIQRQIVA